MPDWSSVAEKRMAGCNSCPFVPSGNVIENGFVSFDFAKKIILELQKNKDKTKIKENFGYIIFKVIQKLKEEKEKQ